MLSKEVSSTILKVFGMTQPGIEPRSPGPLANTLPTGFFIEVICSYCKFLCTGKSRSLEIRELENDAVEKTAPGRRGPGDPRMSFWDRRVGEMML